MTSLKFKISPKIIAILILGWVSFTLRVKMQVEIFFLIFILLVLLLCIDLLLLAFNSIYFILGKKITFTRKIQEKITEGESLSLKMFIHNQGYLPMLNLTINDFLGCDSENQAAHRPA